MRRRLTRSAALAATLLAVSCGDNAAGTTYPQHLAAWGLFAGDGHLQQPVAGVVPYDVIVTLWADAALKYRFVRVPAAMTIHYDAQAKWGLPVGAVLVKTFAFPIDARHPEMGEHLVETRLLVHEADGWHPLAYRWNDAQTDAVYEDTGPGFPLSWIDAAGATHSQTYKMPNLNQCRTCHGERDLEPIGPRTRQLDRTHDYGAGAENQLDHFATLGLFDATPEPAAMRNHLSDAFGADSLDLRARSYLDANCGHCHDSSGHAGPSGFWVDWEDAAIVGHDGVCKVPESCGSNCGGFQFDIVPGDPAHSIIHYRMGATEAGARMPELGTSVVDDQGVELIRQWIVAMPANDCSGGTPDAGVTDGAAHD